MFDFTEIKTRAMNSRLVNDSFWALIGNIAAKGLALIAGIIVARLLGKETFGEYGVIRNTLMTVAIFSTFGLGYTATKYVAEYKNKNPELLRATLIITRNITLLVSGIMAIVLFSSSKYVSKVILEAPHLANSLKLVSVWIVFNAVTTAQVGILAGFGAFKEMAKINTVVGISTFIFSASLTYFWKLEGALTALLLSQIINWFLNYLLVNKRIPKYKVTHKVTKSLLKNILNFSFPVALQEALYSLTSWSTNLLLIKLSSYGEIGLLSAAMQWNAIILFIPGILRNVILSHLAESNNKTERHNRIMKIMLIFNFAMTLIPTLIIVIFSGYITNLYGNSYAGLGTIISLAVFSTIPSSMGSVYIQAFMSKNKNWLTFIIKIFRSIGILLLAYFFINNSNGENGALKLVTSTVTMSFLYFLTLAIVYHKWVNK